jgi:hypothetical protein
VSASIPGIGYCIHVQRLRMERRGVAAARTVSAYQCYWRGTAIGDLFGQMVECSGPGDNTHEVGDVQDRRLVAGLYQLAVHATSKYRTFGYTANQDSKAKPRPALLLTDTDEREGILIHPSSGYLWSVGCLNPCSGLADANSNIDYRDSRRRVIAIIDSVVSLLDARMPKTLGRRIPDACVLIEGEPL